MHFRFEQTVALPRGVLFAFHEDPEHLALLHRGWTTFRLLHHGGCVRRGSRTWVETTVAGILPVVMGFEHTLYDPPHRFGEQLIHGPFRRFTHIHEFEEVDGGTVVRDLLEVELPWCYGGEPAMKLVLSPMLQRAFDCRREALLDLVRSGAVAACLDEPLT